MEELQEYCDKCGNRAGMKGAATAAPSQMMYIREKSTGIATLLALLWSGLGHLYVGRVGRGIGLMFAHLGLIIGGVFFVLVGGLFGGLGGAVGGGILVIVLLFAVWVWNIYDAHRLANDYNDSLRSSGRRPW